MKLLEIVARTYIEKDYTNYLNSEENSMDEEMDEFEKILFEEEKSKSNLPTLPKEYHCKVMLDPSRITAAMESYSIAELSKKNKKLKVDTVVLHLEDGATVYMIGTMEDFKNELIKQNFTDLIN